MKKYICTGSCGGSSDVPGVCQDPACEKHGQPLVETEVPDAPPAEVKN